MPQPNQYGRQRPDVRVTARELLDFQPEKPITEAGLRNNISVGIQYLGAWLAGNGCVPVFNLMEDAATAEISRSQIWQWIRSPKGVLDDGDRKSTRLNSSHGYISYAVFCLKKKKGPRAEPGARRSAARA